MTMKVLMAATALTLSLSGGAMAENLLASNPQSFMDFFFEKGYPAQLSKDSYGDPMIEFRVDGETYPLFFYDCRNNENCLAVQLYGGYQMKEPFPLEKINEWNSGERRFMRAYASAEENSVAVEMDIATSADGISARDFGDLVQLWLDRTAEFEEFIDW